MNKYLVVSYDDDQQQWFFDYVLAPSIEDAEAYVGKVRSYVTAATARPLKDVETIVADLQRGDIDYDTSEPLFECPLCSAFWRKDELHKGNCPVCLDAIPEPEATELELDSILMRKPNGGLE